MIPPGFTLSDGSPRVRKGVVGATAVVVARSVIDAVVVGPIVDVVVAAAAGHRVAPVAPVDRVVSGAAVRPPTGER